MAVFLVSDCCSTAVAIVNFFIDFTVCINRVKYVCFMFKSSYHLCILVNLTGNIMKSLIMVRLDRSDIVFLWHLTWRATRVFAEKTRIEKSLRLNTAYKSTSLFI